MATILHTSVEGDRGTYREHATWAWFDRHEHELPPEWNLHHRIIRTGKEHDFDYDRLLRFYWAADDLLIWERDMVPASARQIREVFACPEPVCSIDYPLTRCYILDVETRDGSPLIPGDTRSHLLVCAEHQAKHSMMRSSVPGSWKEGGPEVVWNDGTWTHCDIPPLGLTRIKKQVMEAIPAKWDPIYWLDLDQFVGQTLALNGVKTHIHYPMARHMRKFEPTACVFVATAERKYPNASIDMVDPRYRARILAKHKVERSHTSFPKVLV